MPTFMPIWAEAREVDGVVRRVVRCTSSATWSGSRRSGSADMRTVNCLVTGRLVGALAVLSGRVDPHRRAQAGRLEPVPLAGDVAKVTISLRSAA